MIVAILTGPGDLAVALGAVRAKGLKVWCIHGKGTGTGKGKGKGAVVGDATVRAAFRGAGWMDARSCAVSEVFTATLYRPAT